MRVLGATEAGAEFLQAHLEPVLDVAAGTALSGLSDEDAALVAGVLELVASAKDADAAATPGPEREYAVGRVLARAADVSEAGVSISLAKWKGKSTHPTLGRGEAARTLPQCRRSPG